MSEPRHRRSTDPHEDGAYDREYERRRADERRAQGGGRGRRDGWRENWARMHRDDDRGWRERGRDFVRRFREPIIGVTAAAAAAPLVNAATATSERDRQRQAQAADRSVDAAESEADLETSVGERWADARMAEIRANTIEGAMFRYDIARDLAADIFDIALAEGIEPEIAYGLVKTESSFRPRAVSGVGARGLTQVMPETARWLLPGTTLEDLFNPEFNLHMGFGYLSDLVEKYNGDIRLALLAYNRGPGTVDRILDRGGDPSNGYAQKVLSG